VERTFVKVAVLKDEVARTAGTRDAVERTREFESMAWERPEPSVAILEGGIAKLSLCGICYSGEQKGEDVR
jgi:hypothetical protein